MLEYRSNRTGECNAGKRYSLPNSRIMIHQPLGGAQGQETDLEIQVNSQSGTMSAHSRPGQHLSKELLLSLSNDKCMSQQEEEYIYFVVTPI